jgi:hypothetical protein
MFVDYFDDKLLLEGLAKLPRLIIGFVAGGTGTKLFTTRQTAKSAV